MPVRRRAAHERVSGIWGSTFATLHVWAGRELAVEKDPDLPQADIREQPTDVLSLLRDHMATPVRSSSIKSCPSLPSPILALSPYFLSRQRPALSRPVHNMIYYTIIIIA